MGVFLTVHVVDYQTIMSRVLDEGYTIRCIRIGSESLLVAKPINSHAGNLALFDKLIYRLT